MADGIVRIKVEDNAKQSADNFKKLDKQLGGTEVAAVGASKSFLTLKTALIGVGSALAVRELARFGKSLIDIASDAEETANKFNTIFRDISDSAVESAETIASSYGLSVNASQKFLSSTGDLLTGLGFTQEQALETSDAVTRLAVDLASFTNIEGGAERASAALTSALLGEREAVKALGIAIGEADIKALAEEKGIVGTLDRQQKALLTLELAVRQSGNAIGDFARSQDSYANRVRIFEAAIEDVSVKLGNELLPVATETFEKLTELLNDDDFTNGLIDFASGIGSAATSLLSIASAIGSVSGKITELSDTVAGGLFGDTFSKAVDDLRELESLQGNVNRQISKLQKTGETGNIFVDLRREAEALKQVVNETNTDKFTEIDTTALDALNTKLNDRARETETAIRESMSNTISITQDGVESLSEGLAEGLTTPFKDGETAAERFGNIVLGVIQQIAKELLAKQLVGIFTSAFTGGTSTGTTDVPLPSAKGNVFEGGNVKAFAKGGVVGSPTFFPMANGGTGLMGEAGAEAIMPLKRTGDGRLGVEASNTSPKVNIYNQSGAQIETVERPDNETDIFIKRVNSVLGSQQSDNAFSSALQRQQVNGVQAG